MAAIMNPNSRTGLDQRDPHDPRTPMQPLNEQITAAISAGFVTVLHDKRAQDAEILSTNKEIVRQLQTIASGLSGATGPRQAMHEYARDTQGHFAPSSSDHAGTRASRTKVQTAPAHDDPAAIRARAGQQAHQMMGDIIGQANDPRLTEAWNLPAPGVPHSTILQPNTPADVFGRLDHPNLETERLGVADVFKGKTNRLDPDKTREQLRTRAARSIQTSAEAWAYAPVQTEDGGGVTKINGKLMRFSSSVHHVDESGNPFDAKGNPLDAAQHLTPVTDKEAAQVTRRLTMARTAVDASSAFAGGAPVGQALAAMIPGAVGVLGGGALAYEGLNKGLEFAQSQIAANRGLAQHYGGSVNDQWSDRASQWVNRNITGRFSMLGTEGYDELFKGAEENGLRGARRQDYIGTGADMMMGGTTSDQAKQLMEIALTTGQGLQGLTKAIKSVGNAARDAGVDAQKARDLFIKNYEASSEMLFGTPGAAKNIATALTNFSTSNGQAYQGVDYTGITSQNTSLASAARLGLTPTQFTAAAKKDPTLVVAASEDNAKTQLDNLTGNGGKKFSEWVQDYMSAHKEWDPGLSADLVDAGEFLSDEGGFRADLIANVLKNNGIQVASDDQALGIAAKMFTNQSLTNQTEKQLQQQKADLTRDPNKVTSHYFYNTDDDIAQRNSFWNRSLLQSVGEDVNTQTGAFTDAKIAAFPVVTQLHAERNELGLEDPNKAQVLIMANGKRTVVPLSTAITNYPDQLQNGSAIFLGGPNDGKSVAQVLGLPQDITSQKATSGDVGGVDQFGNAEPTTPYGSQSYEDYKKERDAKTAKAAKASGNTTESKVTFDLTPEAKKILTQINNSSTAYDTGTG